MRSAKRSAVAEAGICAADVSAWSAPERARSARHPFSLRAVVATSISPLTWQQVDFKSPLIGRWRRQKDAERRDAMR